MLVPSVTNGCGSLSVACCCLQNSVQSYDSSLSFPFIEIWMVHLPLFSSHQIFNWDQHKFGTRTNIIAEAPLSILFFFFSWGTHHLFHHTSSVLHILSLQHYTPSPGAIGRHTHTSLSVKICKKRCWKVYRCITMSITFVYLLLLSCSSH